MPASTAPVSTIDLPDPLTIVVVGDQRSIHVQRWSDALTERGIAIVGIDLARRGRPAPIVAAELLRARWRIGRLAHRPGTVVAIHYLHGGLVATALRGLHPVALHAWGTDLTAVRGGRRGRFHAGQLGALLRHAEAVTATSDFLASVALRHFGIEAAVVPFGIDTSLFHPADREAKRASAQRPLQIGFVKWLEPKYGVQDLVEALGLLADLPFEATLVGDGPLRESLEARIGELGLTERVHFLGRRPHSEIPDLLRGFDLLAMPSREEAWGVAAAEASATAIPVVATNVGGIPEIVVDGETGLLVPPKDPVALAAAIRRLAGDRELRHRMGRAGRERVASLFAWSHCVDLMEGVYRDTAAGRSDSR
ncbi:MAG: glycosyltransferase [Candidatus Limnocylindrales bacterium]